MEAVQCHHRAQKTTSVFLVCPPFRGSRLFAKTAQFLKSSISRKDCYVLCCYILDCYVSGEAARQDSDPLFSMLMTLQVFSLGLQNYKIS